LLVLSGAIRTGIKYGRCLIFEQRDWPDVKIRAVEDIKLIVGFANRKILNMGE